ncbi:hypothetical protein DMP23_07835 [Amycolatopsis sp. A1MSW2902]|uniref:hypothetical protein n=1 Tax=Amycolatopsis sp. A1MSW2902 TaxID=687413 RepID=UPI00307F228F
MTYPRHPVARAREALADRVFALLAAARDASQTFYNVDQVPVAIVSDVYGDDWVEKVADAAAEVLREAASRPGQAT